MFILHVSKSAGIGSSSPATQMKTSSIENGMYRQKDHYSINDEGLYAATYKVISALA